MTMTNAQITADIMKVDVKLIEVFTVLNKHLQFQEAPQPFIDVELMTLFLLGKPTPSSTPIPIEVLNRNYINCIKDSQLPLPQTNLINKRGNQKDNDALSRSIEIHIKAIARGFKQTYLAEKAEEAKKRITHLLKGMKKTQQIDAHVVVGILRDTEIDNYTGEAKPLTFDKLYQNYYAVSNGLSLIETNLYQNELEQLLPSIQIHLDKLATSTFEESQAKQNFFSSLLEKTAGTLLYPIGQIYQRIEEIAHGENLTAHFTAFSMAAIAAWQGYVVGALIAASFLANPLLGAICTSLIATSATLATSSWGESLVHYAFNTRSATESSPLFSLTSRQENFLDSSGFDVKAIEEAIREYAVEFNQRPGDGLAFWKRSNQDIIDKIRTLKGGLENAEVTIRGKFFNLMKAEPEASPPQDLSIGKGQSEFFGQVTEVTATPITKQGVINAATHPTLFAEPPAHDFQGQDFKTEDFVDEQHYQQPSAFGPTPSAPMFNEF